jgi:hypothetical protein
MRENGQLLMEGEDRRCMGNSFDYWSMDRYRLRWIYFDQVDSSLQERNQLWHASVYTLYVYA